VAHLLFLPNDPGPEEVTPFYFASVDLCELAPYLQLLLNTPPSAHGYTRHIHRQNYAAAVFHRFSYFLITCYARNFDAAYADAFGRYLAKVVYVPARVPLEVLERLPQYVVAPVVIAGTSECAARAKELHLPCYRLDEVTAKQLNGEIQRQFSKPVPPLTAEERERMNRGQFDKHVPPNVFVATAPEEYLWEESNLHPYPISGFRLMLPNEALGNQLRRRYIPPPPSERPDPTLNLGRLLASMRTVFAQRLSDYLLQDPEFGLTDPTLAPALRERVQQYVQTGSAEAYEAMLEEAEQHLPTYPGACSYLLCCPAINKKSSEHVFKRTVPDRVLKALYKAAADDFLVYIRRDELRSDKDFQQLEALLFFRNLENAYLSTVLALYAVSYHQPVLRTPQLASGLFGMLRSLRATHTGGNRHAFIRDLRKFGRALLAALPLQVRDFLNSTRTYSVKFISDLPLEWLVIDDVPLMFRHTLSRLPLTPGNALFAHANACREDLQLGPEEAQRVLVCNCLSPNDPLFRYPQVFSRALEKMGLHHSYVEPARVEQYAASICEHKPYILVHWGHGSYDRAQDRGYLHIRGERTEIWNLRGSAVPPIVLLAACETAAIAETHNNPANGWLALGARSVLATYFPVEADLTNVLFTRIFANLLEAVHGKQQLHSWAVIISKTLILNRYLDFFYGFVDWRARRGLSPVPGEALLEYTFLWNQERGSLAEGYRHCPELLARALDRFSSELGDSFREYLQREPTVPHTMFFAHLGAPDTILIRKERSPTYDEDGPALKYWKMRASRDA